MSAGALDQAIKGIAVISAMSVLPYFQATRALATESTSVAQCRALAAWPTGDSGGWSNWSMDAPRALQACAVARDEAPGNEFVRTWYNRARYEAEGWASQRRTWDTTVIRSVVHDLSKYSENNPSAKGFLGELLLDGKRKGLGDTAMEGLKMLQQAASPPNANANAQFMLGRIFEAGFGSDGTQVEWDSESAIGWYEEAAENGDPRAMYYLGYILNRDYRYADGVRFSGEADSERSDFWHSRARERYTPMAAGGDKWAQHNLSNLYFQGNGGPRSNARGLEWAIKAARQGLPEAYGLIAYMLCVGLNSESGIPSNGAAMVYWSKKELLSNSNSFEAIRAGNAFLYGEGVTSNPQRAMEYYSKYPTLPQAAFLLAKLGNLPLIEKLKIYQRDVIDSDACQDERGAEDYCTEALLLLSEAMLQGDADHFLVSDDVDTPDAKVREDAAIRRFQDVKWLDGFGYNRWQADWGLAQIYEQRGDRVAAASHLLAATVYARGPDQANERLARAYAEVADPLHESVRDQLAELAIDAAQPGAGWPQFWDIREFAVRIGRNYEEVRFDCYVVMQQECEGGTKRLDLDQAARWYRLVADSSPEAAFRLGRLLDSRELLALPSEAADAYLEKAKELDGPSGRWSRAADFLSDAKELANISPVRRLSFLSRYLAAAGDHGNTLAFDAVAGRYGDAAMGPAFEYLTSRAAGDGSAKAALAASLAFYGGYDAAIAEAAKMPAEAWNDDVMRDWHLTVDRDIRAALELGITNPKHKDDKLPSVKGLLELAGKAGSQWARNNLDRVALIEVMHANSDFELFPEEARKADVSDLSDTGLTMLRQSIDKSTEVGGLPPVLVNKYFALAREHRLRGNFAKPAEASEHFALSAQAIELGASLARQLTDKTRYLNGSLTYHLSRSCAFKTASERFFDIERGHPEGIVYLKLAFNELQDARQLIAALPQGLRGCFEGLAARQFEDLTDQFSANGLRGEAAWMKGLLHSFERCGRENGASTSCTKAYLHLPYTPQEIKVRDGVQGLSVSDQLELLSKIAELEQATNLTEEQRAERDALSKRLLESRESFALYVDEIRRAAEATRREGTIVWAGDNLRLEDQLRKRDRKRPGRHSAVVQFVLSRQTLDVLLSTGDTSVGWSPPHALRKDIETAAFGFKNALTHLSREPAHDVKVAGEALYKLLDWDRIDRELKKRPKKDTGNVVSTYSEAFGERLQSIISKFPDQQSAADAACASVSQLTSWKFGRSRPDFFALSQLCDLAGVSIEWLASGHSARDSSAKTSQVVMRTQQEHGELPMQMVDPASLESEALVLLPRMDISAAAGSGRLAPDFPQVKSYVALSEEYLRSIGVPPRFAQLLEIDGDSMFPTLKDRDVAVIDTSITDVRSDALYAVVYGGLVVAKRVQINRDGSIVLSSDNKGAGYRDERVSQGDLHDLHIAGRIRGRVGGL